MLAHASMAIAAEADRCKDSVQVAPGESLSLIAKRCATTLPDLLRANPQIQDPDLVPSGAILALPGQPEPRAVQETEPPPATLTVTPRTVVRGTVMTIEVEGLPPRAHVWIKGGRQRASRYHLMLRTARAKSDGTLRAKVKVPSWAKAGPTGFYVSVEVPRLDASLASIPVEVRRPGENP